MRGWEQARLVDLDWSDDESVVRNALGSAQASLRFNHWLPLAPAPTTVWAYLRTATEVRDYERQHRTAASLEVPKEPPSTLLEEAAKLVKEFDDCRWGRAVCFPDFDRVTQWLARYEAAVRKGE